MIIKAKKQASNIKT